eukprot:TRINITY_DN15193_c0_g1_i1.p1 TRINITY_DN15193_c0_g1~~TRINITY_DN15193_c0_g1_i1.p1  ORF type:complete len:452 (+),score=93.14 TRINITY_DN15193_c0_g1_i1:37-1392(+)
MNFNNTNNGNNNNNNNPGHPVEKIRQMGLKNIMDFFDKANPKSYFEKAKLMENEIYRKATQNNPTNLMSEYSENFYKTLKIYLRETYYQKLQACLNDTSKKEKAQVIINQILDEKKINYIQLHQEIKQFFEKPEIKMNELIQKISELKKNEKLQLKKDNLSKYIPQYDFDDNPPLKYLKETSESNDRAKRLNFWWSDNNENKKQKQEAQKGDIPNKNQYISSVEISRVLTTKMETQHNKINLQNLNQFFEQNNSISWSLVIHKNELRISIEYKHKYEPNGINNLIKDKSTLSLSFNPKKSNVPYINNQNTEDFELPTFTKIKTLHIHPNNPNIIQILQNHLDSLDCMFKIRSELNHFSNHFEFEYDMMQISCKYSSNLNSHTDIEPLFLNISHNYPSNPPTYFFQDSLHEHSIRKRFNQLISEQIEKLSITFLLNTWVECVNLDLKSNITN